MSSATTCTWPRATRCTRATSQKLRRCRVAKLRKLEYSSSRKAKRTSPQEAVMSTYTVQYNRSTNHIDGIDAKCTSTGEERGGVVASYAQNACGVLTREM